MKYFLRLWVYFSLVIVMSCSPREQTGTTKRFSAQGKRPDKYFLIAALGSNSYFYDHKLGLRLAGEFFGVETEYKGPSDLNMQAVIQAIELAVAQNPGGIMVVGFEESLNDAVNKAVDAGIPVVTLDSDLPNSKRVAFIGTGNYDAGYLGGKTLGRLLHGKGKVAVMTKVGQSNLEERVRGYKDALATYPGIELVRIGDTKSDITLSAQVASSIISAIPDLAGFGCVESSGVACAVALKEGGLVGKVKVVSMDRDADTLMYIKNGIIDATVVQQTALMPLYGLMVLYQLNHCDVPVTSSNSAAGASGVPRIIDTGMILVDKTNCDYFMR